MRVVIWIGTDGRLIATDLHGRTSFNSITDEEEIVIPFENLINAIDCLRILVGQLSRETH